MLVHPHAGHSAGWWLKLSVSWCVILGTLGGFGYAGYTVYQKPPSAVDECRTGTRIARSVVIVVDASDAATDNDLRRVSATIAEERDHAAPGTKFTILGLNAASPDQPIEFVSVCSPGRVGDSNPLFETSSRVDADWKINFQGPIDTAMGKVSSLPASEHSEIFRLLRSIPNRPDFDGRIENRRLVIISDLLENHPGQYTQLKGGDFWKGFRKSSLAALPLPALTGVDVSIDYLQRPSYASIQGNAHRLFWQQLLQAAGARSVSYVGLSPPVEEPVSEAPMRKRKPAKPEKKKRKEKKP
jgi:hypothetical protein